jgi:hypothetical protein
LNLVLSPPALGDIVEGHHRAQHLIIQLNPRRGVGDGHDGAISSGKDILAAARLNAPSHHSQQMTVRRVKRRAIGVLKMDEFVAVLPEQLGLRPP